MIRGGFLSEEDRKALIALARDGSRVCRVTRRANALVLLDDGMSCQEVARVLLFDDDTIRDWHALFEQRGIEGLTAFDIVGRDAQEYHPQQDLWHLQGVCRSDFEFPERQRPSKLGQISQHSHRQFSCDITEGFSGYRVNRVYQKKFDPIYPEPADL